MYAFPIVPDHQPHFSCWHGVKGRWPGFPARQMLLYSMDTDGIRAITKRRHVDIRTSWEAEMWWATWLGPNLSVSVRLVSSPGQVEGFELNFYICDSSYMIPKSVWYGGLIRHLPLHCVPNQCRGVSCLDRVCIIDFVTFDLLGWCWLDIWWFLGRERANNILKRLSMGRAERKPDLWIVQCPWDYQTRQTSINYATSFDNILSDMIFWSTISFFLWERDS